MTSEKSSNAQYEIVYLAPAQRDLERLRDFLTTNGVALSRAHEIIYGIVNRLRDLRQSPHLGFSLGGKYGLETPYRAHICGKYLAVYEPIEPCKGLQGRIEIRRIYHTKEDYLSQLQQL